ncbi:MAG: ABC transporter ATP-binding protein [Planctomycetota bacterium]|nr:ABC transporter ATP-binding protein/permease [Planctomycetota bacterium]MDW8373470.1 ABC transporter ATP-binding protein [Planctomycetota bacterium]
MSIPRGDDWTTVRRCLRYGWRWRWLVLAGAICTLSFSGLIALLVTRLPELITLLGQAGSGELPDAERRRVIAGLQQLGWEMLPLAPLAAAAAYGAWWFGQLAANRTLQDLRNRVLAHLVRLELAFHQQLARGDLITRMTNDLQATLRLQQLLYGKVLMKPVEAAAMAVALVWIDWRLALAVLIALLPAAVVLWPLLRRTRARSWQVRERTEENFGVLEQITAGITVIKAMGSAEREVARYADSNERLVRANMKLAKTRAQSDALTGFAVFAIAGIGLMTCAWLYERRLIQPAALVVFLGGIGRLINLLREIQRGWGDVQENVPSAERVFALLDRPPALVDDPQAPPCPPLQQGLRFVGVRFRYAPEAEEVLRGIDLEIPRGATVALVGASGGGKSTILHLIPRFYDVTGGQILWDGVDLRRWRLSTIARHIALVGQEPFLFDDTVRANIAYGRPEASDAEIEEAARRAGIHDDILRLEGGQGYLTRVGDRGGRLSGGQRQRIAIARALLRDAPLLLLDEPTSALDPASEQRVQAALAELMRGRTVVMVAHRLATVQHADRIYVIAGKGDPEPGTVLECGTHQELVARGGRYAAMVRLQRLS